MSKLMLHQKSLENSLRYYKSHADAYALRTYRIDVLRQQQSFLKHLPQSSSILDLGCGAGRDARFFLELGFEVTCWDASAQMIAKTRLWTQDRCQYVQRFFHELDEEETYHGIWSMASLVHLDQNSVLPVLQACYRALKPGGVFFIALKHGVGSTTSEDGRFFQNWTFESLCKLTVQVGFQTVSSKLSRSTHKEKSVHREKRQLWLNLIIKKPCLESSRLPEKLLRS